MRFAGYDVHVARTGFEALRVAADSDPAAHPARREPARISTASRSASGCAATATDVPVIFLTARDDPADLRTGFTRGGDDYVTKPFSLEELNYRIQAVLRRTQQATTERRARVRRPPHGRRRPPRDARRYDEIELSPTEFRLLRYLLVNQGRVLSKAQILDHVWQYDFDGDGSVVETYISYLRKKVDRAEPRLIRTVRGFGYSIREPEAVGPPGDDQGAADARRRRAAGRAHRGPRRRHDPLDAQLDGRPDRRPPRGDP